MFFFIYFFFITINFRIQLMPWKLQRSRWILLGLEFPTVGHHLLKANVATYLWGKGGEGEETGAQIWILKLF